MALKTLRTSIRLDKEDLDFLRDAGVLKNNSDGIRFAIKFLRIYGIPAVKAIQEKRKQASVGGKDGSGFGYIPGVPAN